uniref:RING-type E3 ubiquitin transferase n=1 Tax=Fagus sylvatica TaxID=28930 RepID=A0A2N9H9X2_FAGSY
MASRHEALEDLVMEDNQDMIYVAVGVNVKECKSIILWAVQNSGGKRICILHVHQPPQLIPFMGAKVPASSLKEKIVRDHQELERQEMQKIMDEYLQICHKMGVRAQKVYSEKDCIEKGIIELISLHGIRKLVMGAAGEKHFKKESSAGIEAGKANHLRSRDNSGRSIIDIPFSQGMEEIPSLKSRLDAEGSSADEWDGTSRRSPLVYSDCSPRKAVDVTLTSWSEGNELSPFSPASCYSRSPSTVEAASSLMQPSPSLISISSTMSISSSNGAISVVDGNLDNTLHEQLLQAMTEAEKETNRRWKAERDLFEAIRRSKVFQHSANLVTMPLKEAEGLRRKQAEASKHMPQFFSEFLLSEIEEATQGFHESLKIGQGGFGSIYKGSCLESIEACQSCETHWILPRSFCSESMSISRMEALKIDSAARTTALHYHGKLEYASPQSCARSLCIFIAVNLTTLYMNQATTQQCVMLTVPKGTLAYIDPVFLQTGELTTKSDVYSFGIILLQLLTGRPAFLIANDVKLALDERKLKSLLDPSAGDWPFEVAQELACLALRCCAKKRKNRPDLGSDVRKVLEPMRALCGASSSS